MLYVHTNHHTQQRSHQRLRRLAGSECSNADRGNQPCIQPTHQRKNCTRAHRSNADCLFDSNVCHSYARPPVSGAQAEQAAPAYPTTVGRRQVQATSPGTPHTQLSPHQKRPCTYGRSQYRPGQAAALQHLWSWPKHARTAQQQPHSLPHPPAPACPLVAAANRCCCCNMG